MAKVAGKASGFLKGMVTASVAAISFGVYMLWKDRENEKAATKKEEATKKAVVEAAEDDEKIDADAEKKELKEISNQAYGKLVAVFPRLVDEFIEYMKKEFQLAPEHLQRLRLLLVENVTGGKLNRGVLVLNSVHYICKAKKLDAAAREEKALVLGWCIEALQACFLVADDIMDGSTTRRGKPCWYKKPEVGLDAVNDSLILESFIYFLVNRYFEGTPIHMSILKLYQETSLQTQIGQMLDLTSNPQGRPRDENTLAKFNFDLYKQIVKYKTAYYSFYLPCASGMLLCGLTSARELQVAKEINIEIGEKFQIQDDFLDCYGDEAVIGKKGTDIQDHKCSWLLIQAMRKASKEQLAIIQEQYGKHDESAIAKIKALYNELELPAVFARYEQDSYEAIVKLINDNKHIIPRKALLSVLLLIHNRQK